MNDRITEIPIIFPSHVASAVYRYVLNDEKSTIQPCPSKQNPNRETPSMENTSSQGVHCGSASVSVLQLQSFGSAILTTSSLLESPRVLSLALSGDNPSSPVMVELDLGSQTKHYGNTIKVQAFTESWNRQECIRLVLVADNAVVVTLHLTTSNLAPCATKALEIVNIINLLDDNHQAMREAVSGSLIHKTMVEFLTPSSLALAVSPLLMSVDLENRDCEVWLEKRCLDEMRYRESTIESFFSKASGLIIGRPDDRELIDMAPTAALCLCSRGNALLDPKFVFTVHSDGTIRRWTVHEDSLRPLEVCPIIAPLPNPRDWSDNHNSVYVTAKIYGEVFVLAVHIESSSRSSLNGNELGSQGSGSHLFAVYGNKYKRGQNGEALEMAVPSEAAGLVDMNFCPNSNSCNLTAMFRSLTSDQYGTPTTLTAWYPPSVVAIMSTQAKIAPVESFLDGVAHTERSRIGALSFTDESEGNTLEEELHEMDTRFMKYLFRPAYPRGSGTVTPPKDLHILNAIQKLVHGHKRYGKDLDTSQSIELLTLQAMQEWRIKENRQISPQKRKASLKGGGEASRAVSVYDSYVSSFDDEDEENHEAAFDEDDVDQIEGERAFVLELHLRRWRRLLLAIWEEEQSLRSPLGMFVLENSSETILVRSGFTSALVTSGQAGEFDNTLTELDKAATKLIQRLESNEDSFQKLFSTEQRIWKSMARASVDDATPSDFAEECSRAVDFAFDSAQGAVFSTREQQQLSHSLAQISVEDYFLLLQDTPHDKTLPGLSLIDTNWAGISRESVTPRNLIANDQVRHSACAFSVRCVDSSRRLLLGRYLLASYVMRSSRVSTVAFFAYLRTLAVMWAGCQQVPMPPTFAKSSSGNALDQPPKKRLSFGDSISSIIPSSTSTLCMDALLISLLQLKDVSSSGEESPVGRVVALGRDIFCSSMRSTVPGPTDVASGKLLRLIPELGALPLSSSRSVATDHPRIALRLITPLVGLVSMRTPPNVVTARKETLAECLLVESQKDASPGRTLRMRAKACDLLAPEPVESGDLIATKEAFDLLCSLQIEQFAENDVKALAHFLQEMIYGPEGDIRSGIKRLVKLESVRKLFACLVSGSLNTPPGNVSDAVKHLVPKFFHVSNLMHRVDILEHHVGRSRGSQVLIHFINNAIGELNFLFPPEVSHAMPETLSLFNRLFHSAMNARDWNQAYNACLNNPSFERKVTNFKSLVNSMVDAGALQELINKCATLAPSAQECVDLYSIATDALGEACSRDLYLVRANAKDISTAAPDYQGSLYSLHISRGQWREAARSLDQRYVNALRALGSGDEDLNSSTFAVREQLIVEDLVLASVGTANAASLVDEPAAQFIVSGEDSQSPSIFLGTPDNPAAAKRPLGPSQNTPGEMSSLDRIGQFMTLGDLHVRAMWSLAFRKICFDNSTTFTAKAAMLANGSPCVDERALDMFSELGYYLNYIMLTLAKSKTDSYGGGKDRHAFYDSLANLLTNTLVPLSVSSSDVGNRPSLSQLQSALDNANAAPGSAPLVVGRTHKKNFAKILIQSASSDLVEKLTRIHTSAEHPIGLKVAACMLESDCRISKLPCWLEQLMLRGGPKVELVAWGGLFDRRPKPGSSKIYLGDPSALLTLYLQHGMLFEACHVVVEALSTLVVVAENTQGQVHPRLPEKGDVISVPYNKVDILWHLIDKRLMESHIDEDSSKQLKQGQETLVDCLKKHLLIVKNFEIGLRSARALKQDIRY